MNIKAVLLDFDGTLVNNDMLSVCCGIVGKEEESRESDRLRQDGKLVGRQSLVARVNMLKGVTLDQIREKVAENMFLMEGVQELMEYFHNEGIVTILSSGSIQPIVDAYKDILGLDYVIGSKPQIVEGVIEGISEDDFPEGDYKLLESVKVLETLEIGSSEVIALGDSAADKSKFEFASLAIAINPKGGIEKYADFVVNSLSKALDIIKHHND